jgi:hypothetical protein
MTNFARSSLAFALSALFGALSALFGVVTLSMICPPMIGYWLTNRSDSTRDSRPSHGGLRLAANDIHGWNGLFDHLIGDCNRLIASWGGVVQAIWWARRSRWSFGRGASSHISVTVFALAPTDVTVDSLKASALFDLLAPPLHMAGFGVVLS